MVQLESVLLVDDDKITNFLNQRLIEKLSVTKSVKVVCNGKEALEYFQKNSSILPDLILLDINMPVMDGFEFVDNFKTLGLDKKIVIVMLTTSSNEKDIERIAKNNLVSGYINKPLTNEKLTDTLTKYFNS